MPRVGRRIVIVRWKTAKCSRGDYVGRIPPIYKTRNERHLQRWMMTPGEGYQMPGNRIDVRRFRQGDEPVLVEILRLNHQYGSPVVDGPEAMRRVAACAATEFLVAEAEGTVVGLVRGVYDGSRALIHQLSVHPHYQGKGIGSRLVREICQAFASRGAPTLSATVTSNSVGFWEKSGFRRLEVFLVLADSNSVLGHAEARGGAG